MDGNNLLSYRGFVEFRATSNPKIYAQIQSTEITYGHPWHGEPLITLAVFCQEANGEMKSQVNVTIPQFFFHALDPVEAYSD